MAALGANDCKNAMTAQNDRRDYFRDHLSGRWLTNLPEVEVRAHFDGMPERYWQRVGESELLWGLRGIHTFLERIVDNDTPGWTPVVDWRHFPERGFSEVMVCTWDRRGLLAKIAAAFSAVRVNILQADVYTRADNIILDVFRVCDAAGCLAPESTKLQQMTFLLEGALAEPPRFASVWAGLYHKLLPQKKGGRPLIVFDNTTSNDFTIMNVEATDRVGLLHDILHALDAMGLDVAQAIIDTEHDVACDVFYLSDGHGRKILDAACLRTIDASVGAAILAAPEAA